MGTINHHQNPYVFAQLEQLVRACEGNWRFASKVLIAALRVLLTGRFHAEIGSKLNKLTRFHLSAGVEHHKDRLESSGITAEHITAAVNCLSAICSEDSSMSARFYLKEDGDDILCHLHKCSEARSRFIIVPNPTDVLRPLLEPYCGTNFVRNIIAADFREHYQLLGDKVDVSAEIEELSSSFNQFAQIGKKRFSYHELLNYLRGCEVVRENTVEAFIEWLIMTGVLRQNHFVLNGLYRVGRADPSFIANTMLGLYTAVPGLDYLFEGAIRTNELSPISMIIKGATGTGKSSLALTCAAAWASSGGLVQYVAMEQGIANVSTALRNWRLHHESAYGIFDDEVQEEDIVTCLRESRGVFLGGLPGYRLSFEDLKYRLEENIEKSIWSGFGLKLLVVDSASALRRHPNEYLWRAELVEFMEKAKEHGFSTIFVVEEGTPGDDVETFVADTVVRLSYSTYQGGQSNISQYRYRSLWIEKARQQHTCRGQHLFRLSTGTGIRVYPSSGAMLATLKKPERLHREHSPIEVSEHMLQGFDLLAQRDNAFWLQEETCTAIIGEGGTHKSALARVFSKSLVFRHPGTQKLSRGSASLLILFGQQFDASDNEYARELYDLTEHCRCYEVMPMEPADEGSWSRELVLEFPSGYQTGSIVISEIIEAVEYLRSNHCSLARAVLDDLDSMEAEHPILADDEFFLPCTVQLLQSHGASVFLVNRQPRGTFGKHDRKIESLSQNVIRLLRVHERGLDRVAIYVSKSSTGLHNKEEFELVQSPSGGLAILDTLREYRDVRKGGELLRIGLTFLVPAETELQRKYYEEMGDIHKSLQSNFRVHILKPGSDLHKRFLSPRLMFACGDVVVAACDSQDLVGLVDGGYFEELPPLLTHRDIKDVFGESETVESIFTPDGPFLPSIFKHMPLPVVGKEYSKFQMPYYLNPAVLVCRKDFRDMVNAQAGKSYSWSDLAGLAKCYATHRKQPMRYFGCRGVTAQTYACFFIEVFLSLLGEGCRMSKGCMCLCDCLEDNWELACSALATVYGLAGPDSGNGPYLKAQERQKDVKCPFVFRRHWYSTFREEAHDRIRENKDAELTIMPLPQSRSIVGDWHLCVVRGSASPQIGAKFLVEMCSDEMAIERMARGIGLTPKNKFYSSSFDLPISNVSMQIYREIHENGIARSDIRCYKTLSVLLGTCIESFIRRPSSMVNRESIEHFLKSIVSLFSRVRCPVKARST